MGVKKAAYTAWLLTTRLQNDEDSLALAAPKPSSAACGATSSRLVAIAVVIAALTADLKFMLGLVLGGGLALLNYKWLHASLRAALAAGSQKAPPGTLIKFVVRWLVIAAVAWAANKTVTLTRSRYSRGCSRRSGGDDRGCLRYVQERDDKGER